MFASSMRLRVRSLLGIAGHAGVHSLCLSFVSHE
jgi:hypothetical protein